MGRVKYMKTTIKPRIIAEAMALEGKLTPFKDTAENFLKKVREKTRSERIDICLIKDDVTHKELGYAVHSPFEGYLRIEDDI